MVTVNENIRFYKPNDPYFYEVDNLPLIDLLENDKILAEAINDILLSQSNFATEGYVQLAVGDSSIININGDGDTANGGLPNNVIQWVLSQNYGQGSLESLTDTDVAGASDGDALVYNVDEITGESKWVPAQVASTSQKAVYYSETAFSDNSGTEAQYLLAYGNTLSHNTFHTIKFRGPNRLSDPDPRPGLDYGQIPEVPAETTHIICKVRTLGRNEQKSFLNMRMNSEMKEMTMASEHGNNNTGSHQYNDVQFWFPVSRRTDLTETENGITETHLECLPFQYKTKDSVFYQLWFHVAGYVCEV